MTSASTSTSTSAPASPSADARPFLDRSREVLQQLAVLIRNSYLHDLSNQVFEEPLERLDAALARLVVGEGSFRLEAAGEELFANGNRLRMEIRSLHAYKYLLNELAKRGVGGLLVEERPSVESLTLLLSILAEAEIHGEDVDAEAAEALNARLDEQGVTGLSLLPPRGEAPVPDVDTTPDRRERAINAYQQALDFIRESMSSLESPAQLNTRKAKRAVQRLVDLSYEEGGGFSLAGMASIKAHDDYTFNHMVNVCVLAIAFGQRLGLKRQDLGQLGLCALYHDMGKLHIPLEVLNSRTNLTEEEWAVMGNHTIYAARTLFPLIETDRTTVNRILTALQHHLRYDGSGYPALRVRKQQSLYARVTAIVDTFDAMTTKRLYQRQHLPDEAMAVLYKGAGTLYDPLLVKAFINCMGIFPIGSTVLLQSGEIAVVVESNPEPERNHQPTIRVIADPTHAPIEPFLLDLSSESVTGRAIRHCVDPESLGINSAHYVF